MRWQEDMAVIVKDNVHSIQSSQQNGEQIIVTVTQTAKSVSSDGAMRIINNIKKPGKTIEEMSRIPDWAGLLLL